MTDTTRALGPEPAKRDYSDYSDYLTDLADWHRRRACIARDCLRDADERLQHDWNCGKVKARTARPPLFSDGRATHRERLMNCTCGLDDLRARIEKALGKQK